MKSVGDNHSERVTSVRSVSSVREKESSVRDKNNSVRNNNSEGVKSVSICRAKIANKRGQRSFLQLPSRSNFNEVKSCAARERIEEKEELKSELSVQSVGDKSNSDAKKSVEIQRALLTKSNSESLNPNGKKSFKSVQSVGDNHSEGVTSVHSVHSVREKENSVGETTFLIDIHFNAHTNPNARGTETIVSNDATTLELRLASRLAHITSDALDIPLRCIKSESETPHHRLAMLHLTPQSIILEVCFCTSPEDVEAYRKNRAKLAAELAWAIAELLLDGET